MDSLSRIGENENKQLEDWGVKYHELRFGKPGGEIYVDDRTITPDDLVQRWSFWQGIAASWTRQNKPTKNFNLSTDYILDKDDR